MSRKEERDNLTDQKYDPVKHQKMIDDRFENARLKIVDSEEAFETRKSKLDLNLTA